MSSRPTSVTVICWLSIIVGIVIFSEFPTFARTYSSPYNSTFSSIIFRAFVFTPPNLVIFHFYATVLLCVISSIFMLRGENWARLLYMILGGVNFIFSSLNPFVFGPNSLILGYAIIIYLLSRPKCDTFFSK